MDQEAIKRLSGSFSGTAEVESTNPADSFFNGVDKVLDHGGNFALDIAGFIPGVNVITEGAQGTYHQAHAVNDVLDGNWKGALEEEGSAIWHGSMAALNLFTGEGGEVAEGAADALKAGEDVAEAGEAAGAASTATRAAKAAHGIGHDAVEGAKLSGELAEAGTDAAVTAVNWAGGHAPGASELPGYLAAGGDHEAASEPRTAGPALPPAAEAGGPSMPGRWLANAAMAAQALPFAGMY